jgi:hypothetical protein
VVLCCFSLLLVMPLLFSSSLLGSNLCLSVMGVLACQPTIQIHPPQHPMGQTHPEPDPPCLLHGRGASSWRRPPLQQSVPRCGEAASCHEPSFWRQLPWQQFGLQYGEAHAYRPRIQTRLPPSPKDQTRQAREFGHRVCCEPSFLQQLL